ncbi:MAG TPA: hypothetical protein VJP77_04010, partial [Planctomycetota bacterium]|nr:hypothetical protein [Planctomycetota bacterium]
PAELLTLLLATAFTLPRQWPYRRLVWRDFRALLRLAPERTLYPLLRSERAQLRYELRRLDRFAQRLARRAAGG